MSRIRFSAASGSMMGKISEVPVFPDDEFSICFPEHIGDAAQPCFFQKISPQWQSFEDGSWECTFQKEGELSYIINVDPKDDVVDIRISLTNESERQWANSMAFNCFNCSRSVAIRDHECVRHWVREGGQFKRLVEVARKYSPRPTIQLYNVDGSPPAEDVPFVASFKAVPDVTLEGWMAIQSHDGKHLVAVVSNPALFLFHNSEYSCIHSAPTFGALGPAETGSTLTRLYFVNASLEAWYERMKSEMQ